MTPIDFIEALGCGMLGSVTVLGVRYLIARPRHGDPRLKRNFVGGITCPQCKEILSGIYPKFRFCKGPEQDCFDFDGPHLHATCTGKGCDWKGLVRP